MIIVTTTIEAFEDSGYYLLQHGEFDSPDRSAWYLIAACWGWSLLQGMDMRML